MLELEVAYLAIAIATSACLSLTAIPTLAQFLSTSTRRRNYAWIKDTYEDEDGVATLESQKRYSTKTQKLLIGIGCLSGLVLSLVFAIRATTTLGTYEIISAWLFTFSWIVFATEGLYMFLEPNSTKVFASAARLSGIAALFGSSLAVLLLWKYLKGANDMLPIDDMLLFSQIGVTIVILGTAVSIPRRPDVYKDGHLVDRMRTVPILLRYTYAWSNSLLSKAHRGQRIELSDIPEMDARRRAFELEKAFSTMRKSSNLLFQVLRAHWMTFLRHSLLTATISALGFAPHFFLYKILQTLEARSAGVDTGYTVWLWVIGLFLVQSVDSIVRSFVFWISYMGLLIPIRSQLSATIFRKTLLKKDVKGTQQAEPDGVGDIGNGQAQKGSTETVSIEDDEDEDELKNTKQGVINLLAIDTTRISDLCAYFNIFVDSVFGVIFGFGFLITILGWKSLLTGIAAILVIVPINIIVSKRYAKAQDELMKIRDRKMATVSEALQGIRQIKFSALENQWEERILEVRYQELDILKRVFMNDVLLIMCWIANPVFLSVAALGAHAYFYDNLKASVAFTALGIFNELEFTLSVVPELTTDLLDAIVSAKRIKKYLDSAEKQQYTKHTNGVIAIRNATITWAEDEQDKERFTLRDVDIEFPSGELSLITGKTGSGKSLLLACLLGEADLLSGYVELPEPPCRELRSDYSANAANWIIPNAIAYVAQIPWMENMSIKDNILFGLPHDDSRYKKTIQACALDKDMDILADGDLTEIGANGINLSGGQKWRVSFARALYSRAGILVLDDIFSAVDAHVARHIFENGLTGELARGRTRILVTHHLRLCLPEAKGLCVRLGDGVVEQVGLVEDLIKEGKLDTIIAADDAVKETLEEETEVPDSKNRRRQSEIPANAEAVSKLAPPRQFVQIEEREIGAVKWKVYSAYIHASGSKLFWILVFGSFTITEILSLMRSYYVRLWTVSYETEEAHETPVLFRHSLHTLVISNFAKTPEGTNVAFWIGMYALLSLAVCLIGSVKNYIVYIGSLRASKNIFEKLTSTVLRLPLRWLDTVPIGRVLNRFSKDFETLDSKLGNDIAYLFYNLLGIIGIIAAGLVISPYMIVLSVTLLGISVAYATYYLAGAREIKRLESNSRSPIFELFGSTLSGVATIRAFGKADEYIERMFQKIDVYSRCTWYVWLFNRWLGFRMMVVGTIFSMVIAGLVVGLPNIDASLAGFAMSFALNYTASIIWTIRRYANLELDMNSAERIVEYTNLQTEQQIGIVPPAAWPTEGRIEFDELVASYASDLPPVLKGLSFEVKPRERVGVVGRTGAGKSSLTLALFQFIRASSGTIHIDGLNISKISLQHLRSRLAIIPQDPVLFSGTIRSNLDAFNEHTDEELKEALMRVHLTSSSETSTPSASGSTTPTSAENNFNIFRNLNSKVSEGGLNLSQGQRQLLCLARAIVSRPKILVLDEATSAVDMQTEALIKQSIQEEFSNCTTLVIAHRLNTVINYDRILVLSDGKKVEFDTPWELIKKKGAFWEMLQQSGEADLLVKQAREAAGQGGE